MNNIRHLLESIAAGTTLNESSAGRAYEKYIRDISDTFLKAAAARFSGSGYHPDALKRRGLLQAEVIFASILITAVESNRDAEAYMSNIARSSRAPWYSIVSLGRYPYNVLKDKQSLLETPHQTYRKKVLDAKDIILGHIDELPGDLRRKVDSDIASRVALAINKMKDKHKEDENWLLNL